MRGSAAKLLQPPAKNYDYLKKLDTEGWCEELTRLYKLSVENNLGLHTEDPNIIIIRKEGETTIGQIGVPTVQFIGRRDAGFEIPRERLPALIVNVDAPDAVILAEFKRTLKEVRKRHAPPVAKRGRYALNCRFDVYTFWKWRNDKIVQFADLLAWNAARKAQGEPSYREHELGRFIGKKSARETSEVKAILKKALASLPALVAQIAQDMVPAQIAQEMSAARIVRDMKRRG